MFCNIGDCHAMGQRPLTFVRQLLSATCNPSQLLVGDGGGYPSDVRERARGILDNCAGSSIGKSRRRKDKEGRGWREGGGGRRKKGGRINRGIPRVVFNGGSLKLSPVLLRRLVGVACTNPSPPTHTNTNHG